MSLVDIPGGELWPHPSSALNTALASSTLAIDAADERSSAVFQAPKAGDIDTLKFRTGTVTTGATVTVGLYSCDTNGDPDIATGALGTTTLVVADTDDNKWLSVTLGTPVTVTLGQILSMVVSQPSASPGSMQIATTGTSAPTSWAGEFPYGDLYTGTWAKSGYQRPFMSVSYTSGGGVYPTWGRGPFFPGDGATVIGVAFWNSSSAPQEYGNIVIPNRKIRVCGMWAYMTHAAAGDHYFKFYSTPTGTPVAECTTPLIDGAFSSNTSGGIHFWRFTSKLILNAGTKYAFTVLPNTTSDLTLYKTIANATTDMANIEGGSDMYGCSRNSGGGAFTELTTTRYVMGLWIDQGDDGAGGGGGIVSQSRIIQNIGTY